MNPHETKFRNDIEQQYGIGTYDMTGMVYVNQQTSVTMYCNVGEHQFTIKPMHMVRKNAKGCNVCQKNTPYTTEEFIDKVSVLYPYLTFENTVYISQRKGNISVTCHNDPSGSHEWLVSGQTLLRGKTQCGICSGKGGRTQEKFVEIATKVHEGFYDYTRVEYITSEKLVDIVCPEHGSFHQTPKAHLSGRGCPDCGKYGYQPSLPGTFYLQKLVNGDRVLYKFGITGDLVRRITEQSRDSCFEHSVLISLNFDDGTIPLSIEREIKELIPTGTITSDELKSGFTETFEEIHLQSVMMIIERYQ